MGNLRGIILMVAAMAGFSLADMLIKLVSQTLPIGQILIVLGLGGAVIFAGMMLRQGGPLLSRSFFAPTVLIRNTGEIFGTFGFVTALAKTDISSASAILQATPLAITLGAALFLRETVGWRRWSAIGVGFAGVLLIVRPGLAGFEANSLYALLGVVGLSVRDLATRVAPRTISTVQLSTYAFLLLVPTGAVLLFFGGAAQMPDKTATLQLAGMVLMGSLSYFAITTAVRIGEISAIAPYRYSRLVFAMIVGMLVFGERPDLMTLLGSAIIIGSGLYTLAREGKYRPPLSSGRTSG